MSCMLVEYLIEKDELSHHSNCPFLEYNNFFIRDSLLFFLYRFISVKDGLHVIPLYMDIRARIETSLVFVPECI